MEYIYGKEIQSITNHLSNNQGYDLTVTDERDTAVSSEIIVGDTSRAESKAVTASGRQLGDKGNRRKACYKGRQQSVPRRRNKGALFAHNGGRAKQERVLT